MQGEASHVDHSIDEISSMITRRGKYKKVLMVFLIKFSRFTDFPQNEQDVISFFLNQMDRGISAIMISTIKGLWWMKENEILITFTGMNPVP